MYSLVILVLTPTTSLNYNMVQNEKEQESSQSEPLKSATQVLFEHKKKLAEERAKKVLIERQMATAPQLGRGFREGKKNCLFLIFYIIIIRSNGSFKI